MSTKTKQERKSLGRQVYVVVLILTLIKEKGRIGTQEIQDQLAARGFIFSLRSIQRYLNDSKNFGIPICCDGSTPRGWWWKKDANYEEQAIVQTLFAIKEAASVVAI